MQFFSFAQRLLQSLLLASLLHMGLAMAQSEPSLGQIYAAAQSGKLDQAQVMIQQVLVVHPNSGKAHFVRAELYARQGQLKLARESLSQAEQFAPGLAFAKPEAVQALRNQLAGTNAARAKNSYASSGSEGNSASSWTLPLLLAGGVLVAGYFMFRRRQPAGTAQTTDYTQQGGLAGTQSFGTGTPAGGPGAYPAAGYPQAAGSGLGGRIMGGVATGLAVGAGVMAAEAIGKTLMGNRDSAAHGSPPANQDYQSLDANSDLGGANFGVNDASSWDDGSSFDLGGGDWDN